MYEDNKESKVRPTKVKCTFDRVLERARSLYKPQFVRDVATKREAIYRALNLQEASYTRDQFLSEFVNRIGYLLDSKSFVKKCIALGCDEYSIATHLAFEGLSKSRRAIEKGFDEFKNSFSEWDKPLLPLNDEDGLKGLINYDREHRLDDYIHKDDSNKSNVKSE